jgi:hypothetical protein
MKNFMDGISILLYEDVSYLDKILFDEGGRFKVVDAAILSQIPVNHLQIWAKKNAVYQFVTTEMIEWLNDETTGLRTIEICAGLSLIGRSLGIVSTDRKLMDDPEIRAHYQAIKEPTINYPPEVVTMEADKAVIHYNAECVIGAFVTQYGTIPERNCNPYGPHERQILKHVKKYICFGNKNTHAGKHIFKLPHRELSFPWLFTRCADQSLNRVWVWR